MVFCRFEVEYEDIPSDYESEEEKKSDGNRKRCSKEVPRSGLWSEVEEFNERFDGKEFIFQTDCYPGTLIGAAAADSIDAVRDHIADYLDFFYMKQTEITVLEEVTLDSFNDLCDDAERMRYIRRGRKFYSDMGISNVYAEIRRFMCDFGEELVERKEKVKLVRKIEKTLYAETMLPELDRIFAGAGVKTRHGHPCHYFIESA